MAEAFDGVEVSGFPSRVGTENNADGRADHQSDHDPIDRNRHGYTEEFGGDIAAQDAQDHPRNAAHLAEHDRFHDELNHDVALLGANGAPDPDFASALGDRYEHDVHNADTGGDQCNRAHDRDADAYGKCDALRIEETWCSGASH